MNLREGLGEQLVTEDIGEEIFAFAAKIFPICRSITGNGVRQTLCARLVRTLRWRRTRCRRAQRCLIGRSLASGTSVMHISKTAVAKQSLTLTRSNLHVVSYSVPASMYRSQSLAGTFTRCRNNPTLFLVAPRIMLRTGDSACPIVNSNM